MEATTNSSGRRHLVVVVAHPDDESFGCGSLIARAVTAGSRVTVLCGTRGEMGERTPDPETDHLDLAEVRERELRAAAAVLGVSGVEVLDHADSGFDGAMPAGALCALPVGQLVAELDAAFDRLDPTEVLILDGSDGHRDHVHVRDAVEVVLRRRPAVGLTQSSLANSLMRRWVEEMRVRRPDTAYLDIDLDALGRPDAELDVIDTSAQLATRERAMACHRSQRSPYDDLSPDLRRAFLTTDFVVARPADRAPEGT